MEIGKPLSIRIPLGSVTEEFNPSCVAVSKSADDPRGDNFPTNMRVSVIAGAQPSLLISGSAVKQPIVEFTVQSNCSNNKYERTYLLLPEVAMTDAVATVDEESAEPVMEPVAAPEPSKIVAAPLVPRSPVALRTKSKLKSELALRMDDTIATHKKTLLPFRPATTGLNKDFMQKFDKVRTDLDSTASSLDRLSNVVTTQMDMQLKSSSELSRMSTLLVEHDEKIAALSNKVSSVERMERRHDEILSHRVSDNLVTALGGGLLGFCFSAMGFFLFNRRRANAQSAASAVVEPVYQPVREPAVVVAEPYTSSQVDIELDDDPQVSPAIPEEQDQHHLDVAKTTRLVRMV